MELTMKISLLFSKVFFSVVLGFSLLLIETFANAAGLPDYLVSKGGVIYLQTGDSMQTIFHTPPNVKEFLLPGMLLGFLPTDCTPASRGTIGNYYVCYHDLALKPEERNGKTVYRVLDFE
jgi:hypothetical protein